MIKTQIAIIIYFSINSFITGSYYDIFKNQGSKGLFKILLTILFGIFIYLALIIISAIGVIAEELNNIFKFDFFWNWFILKNKSKYINKCNNKYLKQILEKIKDSKSIQNKIFRYCQKLIQKEYDSIHTVGKQASGTINADK